MAPGWFKRRLLHGAGSLYRRSDTQAELGYTVRTDLDVPVCKSVNGSCLVRRQHMFWAMFSECYQ